MDLEQEKVYSFRACLALRLATETSLLPFCSVERFADGGSNNNIFYKEILRVLFIIFSSSLQEVNS